MIAKTVASHFKEVIQDYIQLKGIYRPDPKAVPLEGSQAHKDYVAYLKEQGIWINNLQLSLFETRNGLKFPGLLGIKLFNEATETIKGGETLVSVPKSLMLTTKKAFHSDIQEVFEAHPQFFSPYHSGGWQDRVLLVFLLRQYQLGEKSQWYHLIRNLPRDIDYLIFWTDEELRQLNDQQMIANVIKERAEFQLTYETIKVILSKYPQYFEKETFSQENVKWIQIHLVSRCFGSNIAEVSFVPFCELLNHENTDVRYTGHYEDSNPNKNQQKDLEDIDSAEESDGEKDDHVESEEEYPEDILQQVHEYRQKVPMYKQIDIETNEYRNTLNLLNEEDQYKLQEFEIRQTNRTQLQITYTKTKRELQELLDLKDNHSIIFLEKVISHMKYIISSYDNDQTTYPEAQAQFAEVNQSVQEYITLITAYKKRVSKIDEYKPRQFEFTEKSNEPQTVEELLNQPPVQNVDLFEKQENWEEDKFDRFIIQASKKDTFEKGSQVYFCYGTESNRLLLMRYGFALEYNIFEHIFIRINMLYDIPNTVDVAEYFKLPKYSRFKVKYHKICEDLILYQSLIRWKYSDGVSNIFKYSKESIKASLEILLKHKQEYFKNEILDPSLLTQNVGYHQYFAIVFRQERLRVLLAQIDALELLLDNTHVPQFVWSQNIVNRFLK